MIDWDRKKWRKLYIDEEGSFALLPIYTRAMAAELLKVTDDEGRLFVGDRDPVDVIAGRMGATRGDRRLLKRDIELLLKDRHLEIQGEYLVIRNQVIAQAKPDERQRIEQDSKGLREGYDDDTNSTQESNEPDTNDPRSDHDRATKRPRPCNEATTTVQRSDHDRATKHELSTRNHSPQITREEEIREDKKREEEDRTDPSISLPCPSVILPAPVIAEIAKARECPVKAIEIILKEFQAYWTIEGGAGRRHSLAMWRKKARDEIGIKHRNGRLADIVRELSTAPGSDEITARQKKIAAAQKAGIENQKKRNRKNARSA